MKTRLARSAIAISALFILFILTVTPAVADSYSNGPINGTVDGWTINSGYSVADSFTLNSASTVTSFSAGLWLDFGDVPTGISWAITTAPDFSGFKGTAGISGITGTLGGGTLSNSFLGTNKYFDDIYNSTVTGLNFSLGSGTYYLELFNATSSLGSYVYWDQNNGPSLAYENTIGLLNGNSNFNPAGGSEAFTINGTTATTPEPGTMLMFGTGALGLLGAVRRRFSI
jgi:hypothetical protein